MKLSKKTYSFVVAIEVTPGHCRSFFVNRCKTRGSAGLCAIRYAIRQGILQRQPPPDGSGGWKGVSVAAN